MSVAWLGNTLTIIFIVVFLCHTLLLWIEVRVMEASTLGAYPVEAKSKYGQGPSDLKGLDEGYV